MPTSESCCGLLTHENEADVVKTTLVTDMCGPVTVILVLFVSYRNSRELMKVNEFQCDAEFFLQDDVLKEVNAQNDLFMRRSRSIRIDKNGSHLCSCFVCIKFTDRIHSHPIGANS